MKLVALFFAVALFLGVQQASAQETVEVTQIEKDIIAEELEIGTTNPTANLQVGQSALTGTPATTVESKRLAIATQTHTGGAFDIWERDTPSNANLDFRYGSTNVFTIQHTGNVGVGTTTPAAKFEVQGGTDPVAIRLTETTGTHVNWEMRSYNTAIAGANNQFSIWGGLAGSTQTDRFVIDPNGNVGVGTTAPGAKLDVLSPTDGSATALKLTSGDSGWVANQELRLDFNQNLSTVGRIAETYFNPDWGINFYGYNSGLNSSPIMTLRGSGNVGIGTTAPGYKLDVVGDINASGSVRSAGSALTSDIRLKENLTPVKDSLEKLSTLKAYNYYWKDKKKFSDQKQLGLVAQEVEKVFPEAVLKGSDGFLAVSYANLVAPLIELSIPT